MISPLSPSNGNLSPSLGQTFGSAGRKGEQGERLYEASLRTFATSISTHQPPHSYEIFHSLNIPRGAQDRKTFDGDVDFAIASGNRLVLIDAKLWRPGLYWSIKFPPRTVIELLGNQKYSVWAQWLNRKVLGRRIALRGLSAHVDGKWFLSQNMELALERYRACLEPHGVEVSAMVVFVAAPREPRFLSVSLLRWPGGIATFKAAEGFAHIHSRLRKPEQVHPEVVSLLNRMKRR